MYIYPSCCTLYVVRDERRSKFEVVLFSFVCAFVRALPDKLLKLPETKRASNAFPGRNRLRAFASRAMKL